MRVNVEFDRFAESYSDILDRSVAISGEGSTYFAEYKALYLGRLLGASFSGKILDFGCGVGLLSRYLLKHLPAAHIDGFDISQSSIAHVDPALLSQGVFTSATAELARNYDLIVVANVMHHIAPGERLGLVQDLSRRLRQGGLLSIFEHNPVNPMTRLVVSRCAFDEDAILLSPREVADYVAAVGLRLKCRDYIVFMPGFLAGLRPLERFLSWLPLGAQYAMVAVKHV